MVYFPFEHSVVADAPRQLHLVNHLWLRGSSPPVLLHRLSPQPSPFDFYSPGARAAAQKVMLVGSASLLALLGARFSSYGDT